MTGDLVSLEKLRQYLDLAATDTSNDAFLSSTITRISAEAVKRCNRQFIAASVTEYHRGNGTPKLLVRRPPINSIASIHIDADREFGADTLIPSGDVVISEEVPGEVILDGDMFDKSNDIENVKIVYNGGYAEIPVDLERNILKICACDFLEARRLNNKVEGEKDYEDMRNKAWREITNNYKLITV